MSSLYLIRHGQAGPRARYDALSDLGRRQAYLLGRYLAEQGVAFTACLAGCMNRQRQTAEEVWRAYRDCGVAAPDTISDASWNEFDMAGVFSEFSGLIAADDAAFRRDYEELMRKLDDAGSPVHHAWTDCDTQVMRAWMEARYQGCVESWEAFRRRVLAAREALAAYRPGETLAIFTSAMPIAIWVGAALGVADQKLMPLAGVMRNSAVTTMRLRGDELMLHSFNGVPHLNAAELRTYR